MISKGQLEVDIICAKELQEQAAGEKPGSFYTLAYSNCLDFKHNSVLSITQ